MGGWLKKGCIGVCKKGMAVGIEGEKRVAAVTVGGPPIGEIWLPLKLVDIRSCSPRFAMVKAKNNNQKKCGSQILCIHVVKLSHIASTMTLVRSLSHPWKLVPSYCRSLSSTPLADIDVCPLHFHHSSHNTFTFSLQNLRSSNHPNQNLSLPLFLSSLDTLLYLFSIILYRFHINFLCRQTTCSRSHGP